MQKNNSEKAVSGRQQPEAALASAGPLGVLKKQSFPLYLAGGVLVVVAIGLAFYTIKKNQDREQSCRLLAVSQSARQFEELYQRYPKSPAAPIALLALASAHFSSADYDGAMSRYSEFTQKYPDHPMAEAAALGKIMCFEGRGEIEQALAGFNGFMAGHPASYLTPQAVLGKARCLQLMGKFSDAKIVYEDFIAANAESKWRQHAEASLQMLNRYIRLMQKPAAKKD